jgi:hypothetical protein
MRRFRLLAAILLVVSVGGPAFAEQALANRPRGDVFAGVGFIPGDSRSGPVFSGAVRTGKHIAIVADMGSGLWPVGVGIRVQGDRTISPYGQFLADIYLGIQFGLGIDVRVRDRIFVRGAFDQVFISEDGHSWADSRFSAGLVYQFRRK